MKDEIIDKKKIKGDLITEKRLVFPKQGCKVKGKIHAGSIIAEGPLTVNGNVVSKTLIFCHRELEVSGMIAANEEINGLRNITASDSIHSGKFIQLEGRIKSQKGSITTPGKLQAKKGIEAGTWIIAATIITDESIKAEEYIRAKEISAGENKTIETSQIFGEIKSGFFQKNKES